MTSKNYFNFNHSYAKLPKVFYSQVYPEPCSNPSLLYYNTPLANALEILDTQWTTQQKVAILSGNQILQNGKYIAQAYAGHQFGHFTLLGDGRAILIGEHLTSSQQRFDIQLKGAGRTLYSRGGDGRAPLDAMKREYLISEAMHYLNIPTTRSLAVIKTGDIIQRKNKVPSGILTRVASSHLRIGTFEFAAQFCDKATLASLLNYSIDRHYPALKNTENIAIAFFNQVVESQLELIAQWMRVGFVHGVMNTDNSTISGETIDYGPCAFVDQYRHDISFSSIDTLKRYHYNNQMPIIHWNLSKLAESLLPLIHDNEKEAIARIQPWVDKIPQQLNEKWLVMMRQKLGLMDKQPDDQKLIVDLLQCMHHNRMDFTNTFNFLSDHDIPNNQLDQINDFSLWHQQWQQRLKNSNQSLQQAKQIMEKVNPVIIPRNHLVEMAVHGEQDQFESMLKILKNPYAASKDNLNYRKTPPIPNEPYQTFCGT